MYASHGILCVPTTFYASQQQFTSHDTLRVPWHFTRPMAFYASQQHFTHLNNSLRLMTLYASHGILRVPWHFMRPNNILRISTTVYVS
ncbi:hypothetical protein niasHT_014601 [Heterodera trifolii]|uniref:Uncharacterized protein n=1 Tax=Heterodera trifolii TaxID=157864 RepID=A0ABD2LHR9_9BILA